MCLNEMIDENAQTSSQHLNLNINNNVNSKNLLTLDALSNINKPLTPVTPTTPSITTSMISSKSANVPLVLHTTTTENSIVKSPPIITGPIQSFGNIYVAENDVRPIYSNDNTTNSRFSDENHYIHLYDGSGGGMGGGQGGGCNDKLKPNKNGIDGSDSMANANSDGAGSNSNTTINSNSKIKNNINNNNNSNTSDNNEHDDEGIVVLRHPSASMHIQKVRWTFLLYFFCFSLQICLNSFQFISASLY